MVGQLFSAAESEKIRADFPFLEVLGRGQQPIAYLDSGATSQKPKIVLDTWRDFMINANGAVNRGTHLLADRASQIFEDARVTVADFVGGAWDEICWTKNATEALNLLAYTLGNPAIDGGKPLVGKGDRIVTTRAEHHANLVPWQLLCQRTGAEFAYLDLTAEGRIDLNTLDVITPNTKVVAVTHLSNVSGAKTDLAPIVAAAKRVGAWVVLDTCQSAAHQALNLPELGVDFACLSAHKMAGPTGIGALWGRRELLELLPPFLSGGSMITDVTMEQAMFQPVPDRFEAGTQAVAEIAAWKAAIEYLQKIGMDRIAAHEDAIGAYLLEQIQQIKGVRIIGPHEWVDRSAVIAFDFAGIHPHDVGQILDSVDVAIRVGHHCALPIHKHFGLRASCRASFSFINTMSEADRLLAGLEKVRSFFNRG